MPPTTDPSWATVLSRGLAKKVINAQPQRAKKEDSFNLIPEVLYEHEDLKAEVLTRKATAILQQALTPGSVLFTFPNNTFDRRTTAYRHIMEQISSDVQFRPLSLYQQRTNGDLLVEAKFDRTADAQRAIAQGITHKEVVYKATAAKDNSEGKLTHVQMTIVRMPDMATFLADLQRSLKYYGKVYQIKKYTVDGFFEGHVSFLIDTAVKYKDAEGHAYDVQPLSRMLYLSVWDVYVPASYRGAPPVCHYCRQSGHIRDACPVLAKRQCFKCRKLGHTAKFCREEEKSFEEAVVEYESVSSGCQDPPANPQRRSDQDHTERRREDTPMISDLIEQQLQLKAATAAQLAKQPAPSVSSQVSNLYSTSDDVSLADTDDSMEVDPKSLKRTPTGSNASKHAPLSSSYYMHVDTQESPALDSSSAGAPSDALLRRRHSVSSTPTSQPPSCHDALRA